MVETSKDEIQPVHYATLLLISCKANSFVTVSEDSIPIKLKPTADQETK
jgi:hypothetical protein